MLEYETIFEFLKPEFVAELHACRSQEQGLLNVSLVVKKPAGKLPSNSLGSMIWQMLSAACLNLNGL